jgi:aspartate/methionine/tyrosine aminotransferase
MRLAGRTDEIAPFLAMEVMERGMAMARSGVDVVQMGVGEPDFDAPPEVVEATVRALQSGMTHYTDSRGLHALREAIAEDCLRRRGVEVDPDRIVVTSGTSPGIHMVLALLVGPGDEVIIPTPHYPCYPNMVAICGGRSIFVPTRGEDGYAIDVDAVKAAITDETRAILVASPANPTGAVQSREVMEGLAGLGVPLISDEIYDGLLYDGARATSPLELSGRRGPGAECFVLDGFSKRYAMTGFRLGYVIAPEGAARALQSMQQSLHISASHFVQEAGIAALRHGAAHLARMRDVYDARRRVLVDGLRELGLGLPVAPKGAFYVLVDARHLGERSLDLAFEILDAAHVAVGPGLDFGEIAEGHLRFSFATSEATIREGLRRLAEALPRIGR